jgi:ClpX C4-type zinc finger
MAADLDAERIARCSFCRKHDWEVGRLVASGDGGAFLCDECEAAAHVVMTATPVPAPHGRLPVDRKSIRIDWRKLPHHQMHRLR